MAANAEMSDLGRRIERWRDARGLSRKALSKRAGLGDSAVNDIVSRPERSPRLSSVQAIADALDIPVSALIPGSDRPDVKEAVEPRLREMTLEQMRSSCKPSRAAEALFGTGENVQGIRWFRCECVSFMGFQVRMGDTLSIDSEADILPGDLVVIEKTDASGAPRAMLRCFADPVLFGYDPVGQPIHDYRASPDIQVAGKVVSLSRRYGTDLVRET